VECRRAKQKAQVAWHASLRNLLNIAARRKTQVQPVGCSFRRYRTGTQVPPNLVALGRSLIDTLLSPSYPRLRCISRLSLSVASSPSRMHRKTSRCPSTTRSHTALEPRVRCSGTSVPVARGLPRSDDSSSRAVRTSHAAIGCDMQGNAAVGSPPDVGRDLDIGRYRCCVHVWGFVQPRFWIIPPNI
jgi:hypothetical protein